MNTVSRQHARPSQALAGNCRAECVASSALARPFFSPIVICRIGSEAGRERFTPSHGVSRPYVRGVARLQFVRGTGSPRAFSRVHLLQQAARCISKCFKVLRVHVLNVAVETKHELQRKSVNGAKSHV